jgi:hypothetical protein
MWEYRARVQPAPPAIKTTAAHDGDTVKLLIDLGFDMRTEKWIRLAGVNAPELNEPGGPEAKLFVEKWLMAATLRMPTAKWPLSVVTDITTAAEPTERTTFTRYVGYVHGVYLGDCLNDAVRNFLSTRDRRTQT